MIEYINTANHFLGKILTAALELGDISLLSEDLYWLTNLLNEHQVSVSLLPIFLDVYAQATRKVMGEQGEPNLPLVSSGSTKAKSIRLNQYTKGNA